MSIRSKNAEFFLQLERAREAVLELQQLPDDVLKKVVGDVEVEVLRTYSSEEDPYGQAWQPRKHRGDGHKLLDDTGRMKQSFQLRIVRQGVKAVNTASYARFHQHGTHKMPARSVLPDSRRGVPDGWKEAVSKNLDSWRIGVLERGGWKKTS